MVDLVTGAKQTSFPPDKRAKRLNANTKAKEIPPVYDTRKNQVRMLAYEASLKPTGFRRDIYKVGREVRDWAIRRKPAGFSKIGW